MKSLSFWQYLVINKPTHIALFKLCSIIFAGLSSIYIAILEWSVDEKTGLNIFVEFIICQTFGYSISLIVFIVAIIEGYIKCKITIREYNKINKKIIDKYNLELKPKPLNPKYWYLQLEIVYKKGDRFRPIDNYILNEIENFDNPKMSI